MTTTTVYTDEAGEYYFTPMPTGKYKVWAQAVSFETAKGDIDLSAARRQNFTLSPLTDRNRQVRQLPVTSSTRRCPRRPRRTRA